MKTITLSCQFNCISKYTLSYLGDFSANYALPFNRGLCTCILCRWRFIGMNSNVFSPLLQLDLKEEPEKKSLKNHYLKHPADILSSF